MKPSRIALCLLAGIFAACLLGFAHHGAQAYADEEIALVGTVTEFVWANPHCLIRFDVKDAQGKVASWIGEMNSPSGLSIVGWTRASLKRGDAITVYLHPAKTGNPVGNIMRVTLANGRTLGGGGGAGARGGPGAQPQ
jgi:hypothetical protein